MRFFLVVGLTLLATAPAASTAEKADFVGRLVVTLDGALIQSKGGSPKPLNIYATCDQGVWSDVWAEAQTFNRAVHEGQVTDPSAGVDHIRLMVALAIASDHWVKGGSAVYHIDLKRHRLRSGRHVQGDLQRPFRPVQGCRPRLGHCAAAEPAGHGFHAGPAGRTPAAPLPQGRPASSA